ncbi:ATP-binding protein [Lactobacillus sp.]|uniref:ATP-binding protein n=1 Tax=Lactobacillus sp. TaxID=1591 RepID=UPI00345EB361
MQILDNKAIYIDSNHPIPVVNSAGILLMGLPGTGKTFTGTLIALRIIQKFGGLLEIADSKRSDLYNLKNYLVNGEKRVSATPNQIARMLRIAVQNLNNRYEHFNYHWGWNWLDYHLRPVVIFLDETSATLAEASESKNLKNEILSYLKQLIYRGRQLGYFLILSGQRLSSYSIERDITLELSTRIVMGGNPDSDTLRMAFPGVDVKSLSIPKSLPGHGLIYTDLSGTSTPQVFVSDDITNLDIPKTLNILDTKANGRKFADESSYWKW